MTKFVLLISILSLSFLGCLAQASDYSCRKDSDGAKVKLFGRELGFSSVSECEEQIAHLAVGGPEAVICGCNPDHAPAGSLLAIVGAAMGLIQTNMNLECYQLDGTELRRVHFVSFDVIHRFAPSTANSPRHEERFPERVESCKKEEKRLFIEMNQPRLLHLERESS